MLANFYGSDHDVTLPVDAEGYTALLSNYSDSIVQRDLHLRPYEAIVLYKKESHETVESGQRYRGYNDEGQVFSSANLHHEHSTMNSNSQKEQQIPSIKNWILDLNRAILYEASYIAISSLSG